MSDDGASFSTFSLYASVGAWVICHHYPNQTPILAIDAGKSSVTISVKGRDASESAVEFARALAHHAQAFAAEVERLHAERTTADTAKADESTDRAA